MKKYIGLILLIFYSTVSGCAGLKCPPRRLNNLPGQVSQAIVVTSAAPGSTRARLTTWQREGRNWDQVLEPMDAVIGRGGFAPIEEKREGDGRTPSGAFKLPIAFGYEPAIESQLHYKQVTDQDIWVDDPRSSHYNQWVSGPFEARSHEKLKRDDDLYKYAVVIDYNASPVIPGLGSAIFLHIWRGADKPTAGCIAVSEENIKRILAWLDGAMNPYIVLGEI